MRERVGEDGLREFQSEPSQVRRRSSNRFAITPMATDVFVIAVSPS